MWIYEEICDIGDSEKSRKIRKNREKSGKMWNSVE
jgi:hypothetical protein